MSAIELELTLIEALSAPIERRSVVIWIGAAGVPRFPVKPSVKRTSPAVRVPPVMVLEVELKTHFFEAVGAAESDQLPASETSARLPAPVQ